MLMLRIATVTISAPDASTAARVSAQSRYLPVPTRRRVPQRWPPTMTVSLPLAADDGDYDFELIAVGDQSAAVGGHRDDLAVSIHRHLPAFAVEPCEQRRNVERRVKALGVAVHRYPDHGNNHTSAAPLPS